MRTTLYKTWSVLSVTRIALAASAVADIWLIALWSRLVEGRLPGDIHSMPLLLAWTAGVGVGLYVFGSTLNDALDLRRDRLFDPARPIPARHIGLMHTLVLGLCALLLALGCSLALGIRSALAALVCAALILFYNAAGKHLPAIGVLCLALIRAANMLVADPGIDFLWPIWLNMTHVMFTAALVHRLARKRPYLAPQELWALTGGWVFFTLLLVFWMTTRPYGRADLSLLWIGPVSAGLLALPLGRWLLSRAPDDRAAAQRLRHAAAVWLIVYDATWFLSIGMRWPAALMGWLLLVCLLGLWFTRRLESGLTRGAAYQADRPQTI